MMDPRIRREGDHLRCFFHSHKEKNCVFGNANHHTSLTKEWVDDTKQKK
jgi:hypothetical protein